MGLGPHYQFPFHDMPHVKHQSSSKKRHRKSSNKKHKKANNHLSPVLQKRRRTESGEEQVKTEKEFEEVDLQNKRQQKAQAKAPAYKQGQWTSSSDEKKSRHSSPPQQAEEELPVAKKPSKSRIQTELSKPQIKPATPVADEKLAEINQNITPQKKPEFSAIQATKPGPEIPLPALLKPKSQVLNSNMKESNLMFTPSSIGKVNKFHSNVKQNPQNQLIDGKYAQQIHYTGQKPQKEA